jgi:importin subunit beta-1
MNAEAAGQLVQVLEKTISPDQTELKAAQSFLEAAALSNLPELIKTLSDVLYQGGNSPVVRQQAGVQLKNFLYTNDESLRAQYEARWLAMPEEIRNYTKVINYELFRPLVFYF